MPEPIGYVPPAEYGARDYQQATVAGFNEAGLSDSGYASVRKLYPSKRPARARNGRSIHRKLRCATPIVRPAVKT